MSETLLETLQTFFECDLNITLTAQKLYTHRNTLQQRFNKIEKLTGFSVHSADGLLTLRLALLCYNYLQAGGGDLHPIFGDEMRVKLAENPAEALFI